MHLRSSLIYLESLFVKQELLQSIENADYNDNIGYAFSSLVQIITSPQS